MQERKYLAYLEPFSLTETAAFVAGNIDKGNPHFVAEDAGRIVGWCDISRDSVPTYAHEGMLGMGVLADYRGHGVGERLIRAALDAAASAGFERVALSVYASNTACGSALPQGRLPSTRARAFAAGSSMAHTTTST